MFFCSLHFLWNQMFPIIKLIFFFLPGFKNVSLYLYVVSQLYQCFELMFQNILSNFSLVFFCVFLFKDRPIVKCKLQLYYLHKWKTI